MLHGREHRRWEMRCSERLRLIGHIITLYGEARKRRNILHDWFVETFLEQKYNTGEGVLYLRRLCFSP